MTLIKSNFPVWNDLTDFFDDDWMKSNFSNRRWSPAINVVDNENNYEIEVAAPGLKKEDFNIAVENGVLTVSGKSEHEEEEKKKNYTRKEFSSRSFSKSFTLPQNVEEENVVAKHEDGVLRLVLNKTDKEIPMKKDIRIE
jgi:HSP20 family protein